MDLERYLARIGCESISIDEFDRSTVSTLQEAHLRNVPFENFSILGGEDVEIDRHTLFEKVVDRRRGGFCYELNTLFAWLLSELGVETTVVECRMRRDDGTFGQPFDHMGVLVHLDGDSYLADVGAGRFARAPLPMDGDVVSDVGGSFRVAPAEDDAYHVEVRTDGSWETKYRFTTEPRSLADYEEMCTYHQTSSESGFTQRLTCTKATSSGRITLSDRSFTTTERGEKHRRAVSSPAERRRIVEESFGMPAEEIPTRSFEFQPEDE